MAGADRRKKRQAKPVTLYLSGKPGIKFDPNYFVWPSPIGMIACTVGLSMLALTTFKPESIPDYLGPVGDFVKSLGTEHNTACVYICVFAAIAHSAEAAIAGWLCHDRGFTTSATVKWVFSTFLFGFTSLLLKLVPYKPEYKSEKGN